MALSVKISLNIHFQTLNSRISSFSFQVKPLKVTISSSTSVIAVSVTEVPALCVIEWSWNIDFFFFVVTVHCLQREEQLVVGSRCLFVIIHKCVNLSPAATVLTIMIIPTDGCNTRQHHAHFNWHQVSCLTKTVKSTVSNSFIHY